MLDVIEGGLIELKNALEVVTRFLGILVLMSAVVSYIVLYSYTSVVGRPDLFITALDSGSSTIAWLLATVPVLAALLFLLAITPILYLMSIVMFSEYESEREEVALIFLIPIIIGFATFVVILFFFLDYVKAPFVLLIPVLFALVGFLSLFLISRFRDLLSINCSGLIRSKVVLSVVIFLVLIGVLCSGIMTAFLVIKTYIGGESNEDLYSIAVFLFVMFVVSLVPSFVFIQVRDVYRKILCSCAAMLALFVAFLLFSPGTLATISYGVAGSLEIRQNFTTRFILSSKVNLEDLDAIQWKTRLNSQGRVEVVAFQLFSLDDTLLLCPGEIIKASLYQLSRYTSLCILTKNSVVDRKPPRLRYPVATKKKDPLKGYIELVISFKELFYSKMNR